MYDETKKLSNMDALWIATVLDCEGTLSIHTPWNKIRRNRNLQYFARVQMTNRDVILKLKNLCGGSMGYKPPKEKRAENWYWNITANGLRWLLPQLLSYFIVKKRHAKIILEVLSKNKRGPNNQMSFEELRPLLIELKSLQKTGCQGSIDTIRATFREGQRQNVTKKDTKTGRFMKM